MTIAIGDQWFNLDGFIGINDVIGINGAIGANYDSLASLTPLVSMVLMAPMTPVASLISMSDGACEMWKTHLKSPFKLNFNGANEAIGANHQ